MHKTTAKFLIPFLLSTSVGALTEPEFVQSLLDNHAFFEKEQINLIIKKIEMDGDKANYGDWTWDVSGEIGRIEKDKVKRNYTSSTDYARSTSQDVKKISTDFTKKFFDNGSELNISYDKSLPIKDEAMHDKNGYQTDKNTTEYLDDLEISWTLPLLKNRGGVIDQKTYDLSVLDYKDEKLVLAEIKEDFIESKLMIFLDWVNYNAQIKIIKNRLELSKQMLETLKNKGKNKISILTLQRSINKTQRLLLDLESKLKAEQNTLSILLGNIDLDKNPLKIDWGIQPKLVDNLSNYCEKYIRDIQRIEIEKLKNKRYIESYKNSQLADFDFTITALRDDNKGNYSTYSDSSETQYEAKFEFSYPLTGSVSNQVYLDKYRLKRRQLELKHKDKFDDILSDAQKLTTELKQGVKQLSLHQTQIKEGEAGDTQSELQNFLEGSGNIRFVINEQDDHQELLIDHVQASIDYHKNRIKYDSLLDRLFVNN
jgi:outer membrane protein TolC